ncbi:MAG: glycosyltransferase family 4 protein [Candidatus Paceibacterota bacterium]
MKIAFIHNEKKIGTGANYINDLMSQKLTSSNIDTKNFYPKTSLIETPVHLSGIKNILFFYSLLEKRKEILKYDLIQGTTYTVLPFLAYSIPVVAHFGSTTKGFLDCTPISNQLENGCRKIWYKLKKDGAISELNIKTRKPMKDIADIEEYVASKASAVIATSEKVYSELLSMGAKSENIYLIHNAIEDYWFETPINKDLLTPKIVFLGRLGNDSFTLRLKGLDRLIHLWQKFPTIEKVCLAITTNKTLIEYLKLNILKLTLEVNLKKDNLPNILKSLRGSILFISSRYEGFSLSLIEGMSQGLIPVAYSVGVVPEIIRNGENGYIVSSQTEAIEKVQEILNDEDLRERMSNEAIKTAKQFSSEKITKQLIDLYKKIITVSS